jgi:hypothetical protein
MYYCSYSTFISIVYLLKLPKCGSSAEVCRWWLVRLSHKMTPTGTIFVHSWE